MKLAIYIFKMFIPLLFGALCLFLIGFEIVDLFMNIWKYIINMVPAKVVLKILYLYLPKTVTFALPLSMLFATCYMLCILASQNELVAFFASGISYIKVMLPLIIFSLIMSVGFFVFDDLVVVPSYKKYQELKNTALHIEKNLNNHNIVIRSEDGKLIYKANIYEDFRKRLQDVMIVIRNEDLSLNAIVKANSATWNNDNNYWMLDNPIQYYVNEKGDLVFGRLDYDVEVLLTEVPDTFKNNKIDIETVSVKEAKEYINYLRRTGLPSGEALSVYYKKFSFPYVILIVTILAIGLSGRSRKNVIIVSMILSLGASVSFYVLQMVCMLLAKFGFITPMTGAWLSVVVFLILSLVLLKYSKT